MIELTKLYEILRLYLSKPSNDKQGDSTLISWLDYYRPI